MPLVFNAGLGGSVTTACFVLSAAEGGPHVLSFGFGRDDFIRGFRMRTAPSVAAGQNMFRFCASLSEFRAQLFAEVCGVGSQVVVDLTSPDFSGNNLVSGLSGDSGFFFVNQLARLNGFLNFGFATNDADPGNIVLSVDIIPAEVLKMGFRG